MKSYYWWAFGVLVCICLVVGANMMRHGQDAEPVVGPDIADIADSVKELPPVKTKSLSEALGLPEEEMVEVGGVKRPKRDIANSSFDAVAIREKYLASLPKVGRVPPVSAKSSKAAEVLLKEFDDDSKLAYSSSYTDAAPFNKERYLADPESYLSLTRPGRINQSLEPKKGTSPIRARAGQFFEILQGESVFLEAVADVGMPVTFHTQQLGEFDGGLKTISVATGEDGVARVKYTAVSGVIGSVFVTAVSPVHSGRLSYVVEVKHPN